MSELSARFDLPLGPEAARAARHATRTVLHSWGYCHRAWLDHAEIVVSELVSNAVKHGGGCLSLDLQAHEEHVTVAAADGSAVVPRRRDEPDSDGGRGVLIIEALSTRWGVHDHQGGKRVWIQLRPHPWHPEAAEHSGRRARRSAPTAHAPGATCPGHRPDRHPRDGGTPLAASAHRSWQWADFILALTAQWAGMAACRSSRKDEAPGR